MPRRRRQIKEEVWFWVIFAVIVIYALLAEWWKEHAVIGWTILVILIAAGIFALYRYASVRGWIKRQVKETVEKTIFEETATGREPLPQNTREEVLKRARNRCENEQCNYRGKPHIHHIDNNNSNNNLSNLIALCPNCHQKAHDGVFTETQLINWVRRDYKRLQTSRRRRK
jgi:5-methylcytosine-specific restriction endonuclease McrA